VTARYLLDTNVLLWWLAGHPRLSTTARATIADNVGHLALSAASAWEVCTKHRKGKLPEGSALVNDFAGTLKRFGIAPLDVTLAHACLAGSLPGPHRDPFDRMIIAQSKIEAIPAISSDTAFDAYSVERIW
jgi:PIN domain nuclease of toxin-antitoxin system